ncbi:DUF3127 domain-containing protein [Xylanibacter muris]|uniref:DUF3127 domain-containing protein n=1 Tax=Xylanibacter muris TaxID=2736290 RepID=A0ABX2ARJ5_9BACT|nr:DUF3127 domain-containing protein [Xylanibacter muris]NPD92834.1 DUF3127 domain-containing protein [Xylanibacter muris]
MEITGKIIAVLPANSGVSARTGNPWKSQEFVIETHDQYPRKCCFRVFGEDKINQFNIQSGEELTVSFDIDAHEYNGRWFNNITAWAVNRNVAQMQPGMPPMGGAPMGAPGQMNAATAPFPPAQAAPADQSADDLPF